MESLKIISQSFYCFSTDPGLPKHGRRGKVKVLLGLLADQ